nr:MAG TPA: hypothetical protein [Caudoviricetes sp.]
MTSIFALSAENDWRGLERQMYQMRELRPRIIKAH